MKAELQEYQYIMLITIVQLVQLPYKLEVQWSRVEWMIVFYVLDSKKWNQAHLVPNIWIEQILWIWQWHKLLKLNKLPQHHLLLKYLVMLELSIWKSMELKIFILLKLLIKIICIQSIIPILNSEMYTLLNKFRKLKKFMDHWQNYNVVLLLMEQPLL